jgi:diaminopimelate epimerase
MKLIKSHAFGNDFLLVDAIELPGGDRAALARAVCDRHRGLGADGLLIFTVDGQRASMRLLNADGSPSEISGNGLRCLAAWLAHNGAGPTIAIDTDAGPKRLELLGREGGRYTFRAAMGHPEQVRLETIDVGDRAVEAVTLRVGNPQCVVLGEVSVDRLHTLAATLAVHRIFPRAPTWSWRRSRVPAACAS